MTSVPKSDRPGVQSQPRIERAARAPPTAVTSAPTVDQPPDAPRLAPQPPQVEVQAALEEDHRDGEADQHLQAVAQAVRLDDAQHVGTQQHAGRQQQHDAGHAQVPRQRLREHADGEGQADGEGGILNEVGHGFRWRGRGRAEPRLSGEVAAVYRGAGLLPRVGQAECAMRRQTTFLTSAFLGLVVLTGCASVEPFTAPEVTLVDVRLRI